MNHPVVSQEEWLAARKALLARERAMTHALDALRHRAQLAAPVAEERFVAKHRRGESRAVQGR